MVEDLLLLLVRGLIFVGFSLIFVGFVGFVGFEPYHVINTRMNSFG